jgi:hypothetical protein
MIGVKFVKDTLSTIAKKPQRKAVAEAKNIPFRKAVLSGIHF